MEVPKRQYTHTHTHDWLKVLFSLEPIKDKCSNSYILNPVYTKCVPQLSDFAFNAYLQERYLERIGVEASTTEQQNSQGHTKRVKLPDNTFLLEF